MQLPQLNVIKKSTSVIEEFLGYNAGRRISEQELRDDMNMSCCEYPVLRPRETRNKISMFESESVKDNDTQYDLGIYDYDQVVLCAADKIAYLVGPNLFYNDALVSENFATGEKDQLVYMNGKLVTFPAGRVYDIETKTVNNIGITQEFMNAEAFGFECSAGADVTESFPSFKSGKDYTHTVRLSRSDMPEAYQMFDAAKTGTSNIKLRLESFSSKYFECDTVKYSGYHSSDDTVSLTFYMYTKRKHSSTGNINYEFSLSVVGNTSVSSDTYIEAFLCDSTSYEALSCVKVGNVAPENPEDGDYWIDNSSKSATLKKWVSSSGMWAEVLSAYYKFVIHNNKLDPGFKKGDTVQIDSGNEDVDGQWDIYDLGEDYFVINAILASDAYRFVSKFILSRNCPELNYICENDNRIWGLDVAADEIRVCALGDPFNWEQDSQALSTDSYALKVGSEGAFTGIVAWNGYVLCFKENYIHKMYGTKPTNYSLKTLRCESVQEGAYDSLAVVDGILYYKGIHGVYAYAGNIPELVSKFGDTKYTGGHGAAYKSRYYIKFNEAAFCYDTQYGIWHKESAENVVSNMINHYCDLYYVTKENTSTYANGYKKLTSARISSCVLEDSKYYLQVVNSTITSGQSYRFVCNYDIVSIQNPDKSYVTFTSKENADGTYAISFKATKTVIYLKVQFSKRNYISATTMPGKTVSDVFVAKDYLDGISMTFNSSGKHVFKFESYDYKKYGYPSGSGGSSGSGDVWEEDPETGEIITNNGNGDITIEPEPVTPVIAELVDGDKSIDTNIIYRIEKPEEEGYWYYRYKNLKFSEVNESAFTISLAEKQPEIKLQHFERIETVDSMAYLNRIEPFDGGDSESTFSWKAETGEIGLSLSGKKWVSRILIRASVADGATLKVYTEYDSSGNWHLDYDRTGLKTLNTIVMPIVPRRCDHMRLKFEGTGMVRIYSISKEIESGSEM